MNLPSRDQFVYIMIRSYHGMRWPSIAGARWEGPHAVHALLPPPRSSHVAEETQDFRVIGDWTTELVQFSENIVCVFCLRQLKILLTF